MRVKGLYAEVLRIPGLCDTLQREHRIVVTGPTTLAALLNSLQMGFRTLAIGKRSNAVWALLGSVKTEFGKFGDTLARTKKSSRRRPTRSTRRKCAPGPLNAACGGWRRHRPISSLPWGWMNTLSADPVPQDLACVRNSFKKRRYLR